MEKLATKQSFEVRTSSTIAWMWGTWLALLLAKAIQHQTLPTPYDVEVSLILIIIHALAVTFIFFALQRNTFSFLLFSAFFIRLIALLIDRFAFFELPLMAESGDADGFYFTASLVSTDLSLAGDTYGGAYTALMGYLFHYVGVERITAQYFNVLLGVTTILILATILGDLKISSRVAALTLVVAAFMPMLILHSAVLLREAVIQTLVTAALYTFIRGLSTNSYWWSLLAIAFVLFASMFHAGVVGIIIGFALVSAFTYVQDGRFTFGFQRSAPALIMIGIAAAVLVQNPELFLGKFQGLESAEDLLDYGPRGEGGAAYLTDIQVTDWLSFILYAPLRAFYFIASPLPWDWRGVGDALAFGLDSILYLFTLGLLLFSRKIVSPERRYLFYALALVVLITALIFGVGVSNSGTAMRHRVKLTSIFLVIIALALDKTRTTKTNLKLRESKRVRRQYQTKRENSNKLP